MVGGCSGNGAVGDSADSTNPLGAIAQVQAAAQPAVDGGPESGIDPSAGTAVDLASPAMAVGAVEHERKKSGANRNAGANRGSTIPVPECWGQRLRGWGESASGNVAIGA
jgi:hypothetical protein